MDGDRASISCCLLLDEGRQVPRWQFEALREAVNVGLRIALVAHNRVETRRRRLSKHGAYYALAALSRTSMQQLKLVDVSPLIPPGTPEISFDAESDGLWQRIPAAALEAFVNLDCVVKFGMGLLKDPESIPVRIGTLSYHHGDPAEFRGRPAAYHEIQSGADVVGVVVQRLSNVLDGGEVLSKGYAPVRDFSYARTLDGALEAGVPLLARAVRSLRSSTTPQPKKLGPILRLPSTADVIRFSMFLALTKIRRWMYGLVQEKDWRVAKLPGLWELSQDHGLATGDCAELPLPPRAVFVADPVGLLADGVLCEALRSSSGLGEISRWNGYEWSPVDLGLATGHISYPLTVETPFGCAVVPEISANGPPVLVPFDPTSGITGQAQPLVGLEDERLVDATLFCQREKWFLFGGRRGREDRELRLWTAESPSGPFNEHPESPICLDPRGARMAGPIFLDGDQLYRFGQDCTRGYGRGVVVHIIKELSPSTYREQSLSLVRMVDARGPHSLAVSPSGVWIDYYTDRLTFAAGWRRLRQRLSARVK